MVDSIDPETGEVELSSVPRPTVSYIPSEAAADPKP